MEATEAQHDESKLNEADNDNDIVDDHQFFKDTTEVGIECYMNENTPIQNAVIKHRYSDFVVNEIDRDGNLAFLTRESDVTEEIEQEQEKEEGKQDEQGPRKIEVSEEAKNLATQLLKEDGERLIEFIRRINEGLCERTEHLVLSMYFSSFCYI